jgi:aldehyde dehydrogenase (NAD+)
MVWADDHRIGLQQSREVIEAVTERTAFTLNNSRDIQMAQGLSADITTSED